MTGWWCPLCQQHWQVSQACLASAEPSTQALWLVGGRGPGGHCIPPTRSAGCPLTHPCPLLTGCLLTEESFSLRCPKHKVSPLCPLQCPAAPVAGGPAFRPHIPGDTRPGCSALCGHHTPGGITGGQTGCYWVWDTPAGSQSSYPLPEHKRGDE